MGRLSVLPAPFSRRSDLDSVRIHFKRGQRPVQCRTQNGALRAPQVHSGRREMAKSLTTASCHTAAWCSRDIYKVRPVKRRRDSTLVVPVTTGVPAGWISTLNVWTDQVGQPCIKLSGPGGQGQRREHNGRQGKENRHVVQGGINTKRLVQPPGN